MDKEKANLGDLGWNLGFFLEVSWLILKEYFEPTAGTWKVVSSIKQELSGNTEQLIFFGKNQATYF